MASMMAKVNKRPVLTIITEAPSSDTNDSTPGTPGKSKRKRVRHRKRADTPGPYRAKRVPRPGFDTPALPKPLPTPGTPYLRLTATPRCPPLISTATHQPSVLAFGPDSLCPYPYTPMSAMAGTPQSPSPLMSLLTQRSILLAQSSDLRLKYLHAEAMHTVLTTIADVDSGSHVPDVVGFWGANGEKIGLLADEMRTLMIGIMQIERLLSEVEQGIQQVLILEINAKPREILRSSSPTPTQEDHNAALRQLTEDEPPALPEIRRASTFKVKFTDLPTRQKSASISTPTSPKQMHEVAAEACLLAGEAAQKSRIRRRHTVTNSSWRPPTPYPDRTTFVIPKFAKEVRVVGKGKAKKV